MHEIKGSVTINVNTYDEGVSVIAINHDTNKIFEFTEFVMVGFVDGGEYVANNCTISQVAWGLSRLHDLYDELIAEAQRRNKPKLVVLPTITKKNSDI